MENLNFYLVIFLMGVIIGGAGTASLFSGLMRPSPPEYNQPAYTAAYRAHPVRSLSGAWVALAVIVLSIIAIVILHNIKGT